jgi:N-formylmaleamate deformylase
MFPNWTQNKIIVNGATFNYYRTGAGNKPPLVLVHGFSDMGLCWQETAQDLESEYDIIMPDARGHGLSARVKEGEQTDMTADLAAIINALGLEHPIVGGHSMGAGETAQLGARFPTLARALILEDPPYRMPDPAAAAQPSVISVGNPFHQWIASLPGQTLEQVMAKASEEHPNWSEPVVRYWAEGKRQLDANIFSTNDYKVGAWQEIVKAITVPTLLITADPDLGGIITPELAKMMMELNPNIRLAHIPNVGHHVRFGNYPAYKTAFRAFLKEI